MELVGKEKSLLALVLLIVLLVLCNFVFVFSNGWARLGWQVFGFGGLVVIARLAGLTFSDIGLSKSHLGSGLLYGIISVCIILIGFTIAYFVDPSLFKDSRYHHSITTALYSALLIVPLKTVFFEELAFRGIMPALLKGVGLKVVPIVLVSALLFGLWHISSAPKSGTISVTHASNWMLMSGVFLITSIAGALFYLLRYQSDSLVASIIVHWFINGAAIVLASLSWLYHPIK